MPGRPRWKISLLLLRRDLALDPDEALLRVEALAQFVGVDVGQNGGDEFDRFVLVDDVARLGEDRHGLDVGGENIAVAVEQIGARAGGGLIGGDLQRLRRLVRQAVMGELGGDAEIGDGRAAASTGGCARRSCRAASRTARAKRVRQAAADVRLAGSRAVMASPRGRRDRAAKRPPRRWRATTSAPCPATAARGRSSRPARSSRRCLPAARSG